MSANFDAQGNHIGFDSFQDGELMGWIRQEGGRIVYYDAEGNENIYMNCFVRR